MNKGLGGKNLIHQVSERNSHLGDSFATESLLMDEVPEPVQHRRFVSATTPRARPGGPTVPMLSNTSIPSETKSSQPAVIAPDGYQFDSEIREQQLVRRTVKPGMTVFDVGAHLGKYTKLFSLLVGDRGKVYAFEPSESSFRKLASAARSFNHANVVLVNKAVYSENGSVLLNEFAEEYSSWNSLGLPHMEKPKDPATTVPIERSVRVGAVALDAFCRQHNINAIDYLKLDVEGSELEVLVGASRLLENKAIGHVQFEISKPMLEGCNTKASFVFDFLKSKGYECHVINHDGTIGSIVSDSDSFYENYIAVPTAATGARSAEGPMNAGFTDGDLWTPQTYMLRAIMDWLDQTSFEPRFALSIDRNPPLDEMIIRRWPGVTIDRAVYPEFDAQDLSRIPDNQYDLVYSNQILEHIPKPWVAAAEMVRVLRTGGIGLHTSCAFNPRHGPPAFNDYYRFLPDGLAELFGGVKLLVKAGWGNRQALLYNLGIDDGHGGLGGRRFCEHVGSRNDEQYPWHVWIIFEKVQK